ncbi:MAG: TonB-dependent receptor [Bacteroidota bacterium]
MIQPADGQSIASISGNVVNTNGDILAGNALVLSPIDSTIIAGTSFFDGKFALENLKAKTVLLKLTSLEFRDTYINLEFEGQTAIDLGDIVVGEASTALEEVVVVSKTPLVKQRPDGSIEIKVENTTLATSTSAQEILSKSPSVLVDENNGISIFGKGDAVIFVNGIKVGNERLSTISPSNIDKIEIITNPGPRYDAEGNAVINIKTKRNTEEGTKGMLKNYYSYSDFAGYDNRTNVDLSSKGRKWSMNATYGLLVGNDRWLKTTTRTRDEVGDFFSSDIELDWLYERNNFSNYILGAQYDSSEDTYISLEYNGAYEAMGGDQISENTIIDNEFGSYNSILKMDDLNRKNIFNLNYSTQLDSLGTNLFIGGQYASYRNDFDNQINEASIIEGAESNSRINNSGEGNIQMVSAQLDYTKVYHNSSLEMGGKFAYVNNTSFTDFFDLDEDGTPIRDTELSNNFQYDERVPALYLNIGRRLNENTDYSLGLRTELTDYTLFTSVDGGAVIEDNYINVFPNASFETKLSKNTNFFFTYSSRIRRPSYETLNPFVIYQDEFTSIRGNPNLQPARIHSFEIGGTHKDWNLKFGYTYTIDRITRAAFQLENASREYVLQTINFDKEHAFFVTLSKNINLKWWQSINNISVSYNDLIDNTGVFEIRDNEPSFYFYSQNSFTISNWFTMYFTAWYLSDLQDGIYLRKNQSTVNIGIEKRIWEDALKLNVDFNDVFQGIRADGSYRSGTTDIIYGNRFNTNYVRFAVSYNFGKLKKTNYQIKNVGESENRRTQ